MTKPSDKPGVTAPKESRRPWLRSERALPRLVVRPLERFLRLEAGSAALLMAAAVAALLWANLAQGSYEDLWATEVSLDMGPLTLEEDLLHVVNDLLMAIFFYVVALEVKREILFGSLRDPRSAAVPSRGVRDDDRRRAHLRRNQPRRGRAAGMGDPDRHR